MPSRTRGEFQKHSARPLPPPVMLEVSLYSRVHGCPLCSFQTLTGGAAGKLNVQPASSAAKRPQVEAKTRLRHRLEQMAKSCCGSFI